MIDVFFPLCDKVDENLFYKGVDKHLVEPARLSQHHSLSEATGDGRERVGKAETLNEDEKPMQPPYSFHSGDSLLALTKKHNVNHGFSLFFF